MSFLELFLIAAGLSMDAFAVSICKGLTLQEKTWKKTWLPSLASGLWFGAFQGLMPLAGYFVGARFSSLVGNFDHWIVFVLLAFIGGRMVRESRQPESCPTPSFRPMAMFPLAVATSIDALAVGVSLAFLDVNILFAAGIIAGTTFLFSFAGTRAGCFLGARFESWAELAGGLVLIGIGVKVLLEHLWS
jgi:putative Mn2+ efflux pump MntP